MTIMLTGTWGTRYGNCGRLLIDEAVTDLGMSHGRWIGISIRSENVYHVLVPVSQPFVPLSFALILSPISYTDNSFWHSTGITQTSGQMTPALSPRERARMVAKTPYHRASAIKNLHPGLQDIIKNCPALDVIFDHDNPRSSTYSRGRGRDKEHVARPPNAFMVYRSYVWYTKQLEDNDEKNLSCVSRLAGRSWMVLSEQARTPFKQVADIAKREHAERNPDYKYAPSSRSQKSQKKPARRASRAKEKVKVTVAATVHNDAFATLLQSKETTPTPAGTPSAASVDTPPASSEFSSSSSSSSSPSSPSTSPAPREFALHLPPPSSQLGYPVDYDLAGYPPRPRFRPVTSGLIPSPFMSVLQLNDVHMPSILDELPDVCPTSISLRRSEQLTILQKYKEAELYHDLQPHALVFKEGIPFDDANTPISVPSHAQSIDYSSFISGNPEVKLGSPIPDHCFSPGPSTTTAIDEDFNTSIASTLNWSIFDMPTLDFDRIVDEPSMYDPNDADFFDSIITCGGY